MSKQPSNSHHKKRGGQPGNHNALKIVEGAAPKNIKPESNKKRGAPIGNTNALTHGFYANRLNQRSLEGLEQVGANTLQDEIDVMRVYSRKVAELGDSVEDLEKAKSVLNTLSNSTSTINRLVRTNAYIPKPEQSPAEMLMQALDELEEEWPEFKRLVQKYYPDYKSDSEDEKKS